jgi:hypothetical protein
VLFPTPTVIEVGDTLTEERVGTGRVTVIVVGGLWMVFPLSVAFTKRSTNPGAAPALKVVVGPVAGLRVP